MWIKNIKGPGLRRSSGQSTVEYVLLVTAVVAVMIAFATKPNSGLQSKLNSMLDESTNTIGDISGTLSDSEAAGQAKASPPAPVTLNVLDDKHNFGNQ